MGRTLPSITQVFLQEQEAFNRFRRALRRSDQLVLDALFAAAHQHVAAAAYASHALPFEVFLLAMLLEEHKTVLRLGQAIQERSARMQRPAGLPEHRSPSRCNPHAARRRKGCGSRPRRLPK